MTTNVARDICDKIKAIDAQIVQLNSDGYAIEIDRLLDERRALTGALDVIAIGILARS